MIINLMPPEHKEAIMYARRNSKIMRWLLGVSLAALLLIVVAGGGLFYLKQDSKAHQKNIETTKAALAAQNEAETFKRVQEIGENLNLVVDVLSDEVLFSKLLQQIGEVMPSGTILQDLSLTSDFKGGLSLRVGSVNYEAGTQAHVNLADKNNGIFEKADLINLTCTSGQNADPRYPCQVEIKALFNQDDNPFLLLNQNKETN
ncbi:MAG: hypothetical protein M3Q14_04690 [bacterium]|nr:hypothetical protein [bacterium]